MLSIRGARERLTPPCTGLALLSHSFLVVLCLLREAKEIGHVCTQAFVTSPVIKMAGEGRKLFCKT